MKTCNIARPSAMKSQEAGFWAGGPVFATNFTGAKTVPVARGGGKKPPASAERLTGGTKLFFCSMFLKIATKLVRAIMKPSFSSAHCEGGEIIEGTIEMQRK